MVIKAAAVGAAMTSLASYPRLVLWSDRAHQLWFLALTLAWASFILWSFVFAWHAKFSRCPFFFARADLKLFSTATGSGLLGALALELWIDPVLRPLVPDDYPATLESWLAMTLFALSFDQLFLCFAPFAFFLRLTRRPRTAGGLTVLFGVFLLYLQARARLGQAALLFVIGLFAWRAVAGFLSVFFLVKGGAIMTLWWVFLLQLRHLLHIA